MDKLLQDLRQSLRTLRRSPAFTAVAVLTMALGIGANAAMFSVVNGVLLTPLPYADPGKLVRVWSSDVQGSRAAGDRSEVSPGDFLDWQAQSRTLSHLSAFTLGGDAALSDGGEPEQIATSNVSSNLFVLLGIRPAYGRDFLAQDAEPDRTNVIISDGLWRRRLSADPQAVGRTVRLDGRPATVIGIMPKGFDFPSGVEVWRPLRLSYTREAMFLHVVGRLAPGQTLSSVRTEMDGLAKAFEQQYPKSNTGWGVNVIPLFVQEVGRDRRALLVLSGIVVFVLLIACANLANLLSARASVRRREMALRTALGAGRARLIRQLFTESLVLSALGGAAGLIVASLATPVLLALNPDGLSRAPTAMIDGRVLLFTAAVSMLAGLLFGLAPAFQLGRLDLDRPLREAGRTGAKGRTEGRSRRWLVVSEVALALAVLTAAGLTMKSFLRVLSVDSGVQAKNVLTLEVRPASGANIDARARAFYPDLIERLERVPGIVSAAATYLLPLGGDNRVYGFRAEGLPPGRYGANYRVVTPHYFRTMGMTLVDGRDFGTQDTVGAPPVLVVNQQMARRFWPGVPSVLGREIFIRGGLIPTSIVGVVSDVRHFGVELGAEPEMYVAHAQVSMSRMTVVIRTLGDPAGFIATVKNHVRAMDPNLPVSNIQTMDQLLAASTAPRRFTMVLFTVFGGVALLLAAVGVYGVTSHAVGERTGEIGIRAALGATPRQILTLIIGQHAKLLLVGIGLGALAALGVGRLTARMLFEVKPNDPLVFLTGAVVLAVAGLAASYIPARRALAIDPIAVLKSE
jgi:putative ABC transport system permease protein